MIETNLEKAFGKALHDVRTSLNISQEKLALLCNLDRTSISRLERGLRTPNIRTIFALSKILKIKPSEMLSKVEEALQ